MRRADIHQHLWPDALLSSLARRTVHPRLRRHDRDRVLEPAGEPPHLVDTDAHDPTAREAFYFTASDIHRVRHTGRAPAVTIHAYSPPLWRMGDYEVLAGGELRRHSLSYAEELRPLGP